MAEGAPDKTIYAFDSFQGIPLPSNKDDQYPGIRKIKANEQRLLPNPGEQELVSSGATVYSIDQFWDNIVYSGVNNENIVIVDGWFEETLPSWLGIVKIAILRLDGDLYNSTLVCLKHLYPSVIDGGLVIIDDWGLPGCRAAVYDYFDNDLPDIKYISDIAYFYK
jgi:O-methyltransferase